LSLNYLSLTNGQAGVKALRELLQLYSFSQNASTYRQIEGIRDVRSRQVVRRAGPEAWRGFTSGTEITLELDEDYFAGTGPFLLGAVLHRFFGLYASINSFTQLIVRSTHREAEWKSWPPLAGAQRLT
jgi:type VI secretion system protein ImpG